MRRVLVACLLFQVITGTISAYAGGPRMVGGPKFGVDALPFTWDPAKMPIQYRVDPGPMAVNASGATVLDNAAGLQRVQSMFGVWQAVATAAISFTNAGPLLAAGTYVSGADLSTVQQFNDVVGSCKSGTQNPVMFDANGQIMAGLGLPAAVIGFSGSCAVDSSGHFNGALVLMNGKFQDGISTPTSSPANFELTANEFDEAITHEIGHFLGLDHSQINVDLLTNNPSGTCDIDKLAGLPLMFPIELCQARKDAGLPVLSPDDLSWISRLYPSTNFVSNYGTISGTIYFPDTVSQTQGVNVIARAVDDPKTPQDESRRIAVSVVSGYLFTGNPGQSFTANMPDPNENNANGDTTGSRNSKLIGYYEIAVPPGTYTVEVESVFPLFTAGSSVGPLDPPVPIPGQPEFWNKDESAFDFPQARDTITISPGDKLTGIDIILNTSTPTFDQFEDSGAVFDAPLTPVLTLALEVHA